jgi:hypothetical protein
LRRDLVFAVYILDDKDSGSWLSRDSEWRKAWAFDRDCILRVTTEESGTRYLKVRLFESPDISTETDPRGNTLNVAKMVCIAGDPFWYEDDATFAVTTSKDTRFDPKPFNGKWNWDKQPKESLTLAVSNVNPTDQYIFPKWGLPGATEKLPEHKGLFGQPVEFAWEQAPFTQFVIPDYSFEDEELADRRVRSPGLVYGENCVLDTDPRVEQWQSETGSPVWSRTNGVRWRHPIPPYTYTKDFKIDVSGVNRGQVITLRLPRPWSRPWGMS